MPGCKCCNSPHLDFINTLLLRGETTREISNRLREDHDISVSHMSIWRHYKNHLLPSLWRVEDPLRELDRLGQSRLKRAIYRGIKISKTHPRCSCPNPASFRKRGIVYVCRECGGWIPACTARALKKIQKAEKRRSEPIYIVATHPRRR